MMMTRWTHHMEIDVQNVLANGEDNMRAGPCGAVS